MKNAFLTRPANLALLALTLFYVMMLGGGMYEQMNVTGVIASAPPRSLYMLQGDFGFRPVKFWGTFRPITIFLFVVALALNWKTSRRNWVVVAFLIDVAITLATVAYFAPATAIFVSASYSPDAPVDVLLFEKAQQWMRLNYIRLGAFFVASVLLLIAVAKKGTDE